MRKDEMYTLLAIALNAFYDSEPKKWDEKKAEVEREMDARGKTPCLDYFTNVMHCE